MNTASSSQSRAMELLTCLWGGEGASSGHSWERLNHAMRRGLVLAIGAGLKFCAGDFEAIIARLGGSHWLGDSDEWIYTEALSCGNRSAWKAYEAWKDRRPFLANDVTLPGNGFVHATFIHSKRGRLAVGAYFQWKGTRVWVTSFAADNSYLTACAKEWVTEGSYPRERIVKRFRITREDLALAFPSTKPKAKRAC